MTASRTGKMIYERALRNRDGMIKDISEWLFWILFACGVIYAGFYWNAGDEMWMHRAGACTHTKKFCEEENKLQELGK